MGSKIIMDEMKNKNHGTPHHVGIDPYGDIKYVHFDKEHDFIEHPKTDYTNLMKLRFKKRPDRLSQLPPDGNDGPRIHG